MVSKIELYREVLEIEPNSKVFFPLARQLAEEGRQDEAAAVLSRGIGFHPDHLEAKFLLIEILTRQGREEQAQGIFTDVGSMLSRYPSVWLLWSKNAAARSKDPSLAMLFLAHYFQNQTLTWADVMERGLQSLTQAGGKPPEYAARQAAPTPVGDAAVAPTPQPRAAVPVPQPTPQAGAGVDTPSELPPAATAPARAPQPATAADLIPAPPVAADLPLAEHPVGRADRDVSEGPELRGAREVLALADLLDIADEVPERTRPRTAKGREPGVRTKTMAAVLADQGETAAALEIYSELLDAAPSGPEREELTALMAALSPQPEAAEETAAPVMTAPQPVDVEQPDRSPARLVSFLEALAGRLEARAGS
ncbi:tetratricopeptide repeat protein [Solidesulfovibrio sp.]